MAATPITNVNVEAQAATNDYNLPADIDDGVILQAWNWSFDTIKQKLPEIAEAGYTAVQTSPIQGTKENSMATANWWVLYQPTNYKIGNAQLGTRDQFKSMCEAAEDYGIKIIVDVVANHTANSGSAQYYADSTVDSDIRNNENFWHEHRGIESYDDRWQVTHWGIGLPDLNTSNWDLQNKVIDFLNDCITCGADGFRFDAAKHIELPSDPGGSDFWTRVLGSLNRDDLYIYGEVLQGGADNFTGYTQYMDVTASNYGATIRSAVGYNSSINLYNTSNYSVPSGVNADKLVTWVESHDNYANDEKASTYMSDYQIKMGWSIIAARADSSALFFARPAGSTQNSGSMGVVGSTLWEDSVVTEVNKFHNEMVGQGEYKDTVSGNVFTVANGKISGYVNGYSVAVLYNSEDNPQVASNKENCEFINSIDVVLSASDTETATYSIDGGAETQYTNGTTVNLGADKAIGSTTTLTLKGYKGDKVVTQSYSYKKVEKQENAVVYLEKPDSWGTPNIYVYDDSSSTVKMVAAWPGVQMTSEGGNLYSYTLPDGWNTAKVIFNDGSNQVPAVGQTGFYIKLGETKIYQNGNWLDY